MGIPKFYRWLSERYPLINQVVKGSLRPEFDNLYLDMNGIIHMCSHPRDGVDAKGEQMTEEQMFGSIFEYIDRIFHLISPKKLLFMAVDGVAPRAKMNQQRQRRFKSAKEAEEAIRQAQAEGHKVSKEDLFDSNCITPGTEFMARLCKHLRYFVRKKMQEDAAWRKIRVILSGPDIPGEGEHKIMMYIRRIKAIGEFAPNERHCMYGLDADLIMLALVTHEPHFALLREEVIFGQSRRSFGFSRKAVGKMDEFQLLHISLLRQYLDLEMRGVPIAGDTAGGKGQEAAKYDLERIVDDFVVMCMLVGNDFIPNVPMLDIAEDGLDRLFESYKTEVLPRHGYIMNQGKIRHKAYTAFLQTVSDITRKIWKERVDNNFQAPLSARRSRYRAPPPPMSAEELVKNAEESKEIDAMQSGGLAGKVHRFSSKENLAYYKLKFRHFFWQKTAVNVVGATENKVADAQFSKEMIRSLCRDYLDGIVWCIRYYYEGCASWSWFYPHFYAPMADELACLLTESDYKNAGGTFLEGNPVKPLEQLLSVLPSHSKALLPPSVRPLVEQGSAIQSYYPSEFKLDSNFKSTPWEAIAMIPFIDFEKLTSAINDTGAFAKLSGEEKLRNARYGANYIYYYDPKLDKESFLDSKEFKGGKVEIKELPAVKPTLKGLPVIPNPVSREVLYEFPVKRLFIPRPILGTIEPLPGYPCLRLFKVETKLEKVGVNIFGRPSSKPSLVLNLPELKKGLSHRKLAEFFLGPRTCFVGWPYLREARVKAVMDADTCWVARKVMRGGKKASEIVSTTMSQKQRHVLNQAAIALKIEYLTKKAARLGSVNLVFRVNMFEGMRRQADGRVLKTFSHEEVLVPASVVLTRNPKPDPRFCEQQQAAVFKEFPIGCQVVFYGDSPKNLHGTLARVKAHLETRDKSMIQVEYTAVEKKGITSFGSKIREVLAKTEPRYFSGPKVAQSLKMSTSVLSQVTSSVLIKPRNVEIGLQLKSTKHQKMVPGYTRINPATGRWEYSLLAIKLVYEYRSRFPRVFLALQRKKSGMFLDIADLVQKKDREGYEMVGGDRKVQEESLAKITSWMKSIPTTSLLAFPTTSKVYAKPAILALEAAVAKCLKLSKGTSDQAKANKKTISFEASAKVFHALYRIDPSVPWTPTPRFSLGDRVCCLRGDLGVPVGLHGTVVGLHLDEQRTGLRCDVLFDEKMVSGTSLNAMCSQGLGKSLPSSALLNLTNTKVQFQTAANPLPKAASQGQKAEGSRSTYAWEKPTPQQKSVKAVMVDKKSVNTKGDGVGITSNTSNGHVIMPSEAKDRQTPGLIGTAKKVPRCAGCTRPLADRDWTTASRSPFCSSCSSKKKTIPRAVDPAKQASTKAKKRPVVTKAVAAITEEESADIPKEDTKEPEKAAYGVLNALFAEARANKNIQDKSVPPAGQGDRPQILPNGSMVRLVGYSKKKAHFNGRTGKITEYKQDLSRYVVELGPNEIFAIKPRYLLPLTPPSRASTAVSAPPPRPQQMPMARVNPSVPPPRPVSMGMVPGQPHPMPPPPGMPMPMPGPMGPLPHHLRQPQSFHPSAAGIPLPLPLMRPPQSPMPVPGGVPLLPMPSPSPQRPTPQRSAADKYSAYLQYQSPMRNTQRQLDFLPDLKFPNEKEKEDFEAAVGALFSDKPSGEDAGGEEDDGPVEEEIEDEEIEYDDYDLHDTGGELDQEENREQSKPKSKLDAIKAQLKSFR
eukprot:CAMPEP_0184497306 /NCGR_PEP_ID=MMETSP0113_2-20130426/36138_1 /TAXON_ID=91329 /ORGANISM="Norrisiella sphaerica, Strain BC52" /LENGTH=1717 /DNA_ID=CAMNT_0026884339 /DNA_START=126 /DNA_END=5279 /DNA_ORIENTATION=+